MRDIKSFGIVLLLALCFGIYSQEPVTEQVKVVNVEVPVRVFYKNQPVDNITVDKFKLYENKKKQEITSFKVVRKKMQLTADSLQEPRYIVLIFRLYNYSPEISEGLDYIFANLLKENARLLVFADNRSLSFEKIGGKAGALKKINTLLQEQSKYARGNLLSYIKRIESQVSMRQFKRDLQRAEFMKTKEFLKKYLREWKAYKTQYLMPDINNYYNFAHHLEGIKMEKWVINFYQMEMIPDIIMSNDIRSQLNRFIGNLLESGAGEQISYGNVLRTILNEIDKEFTINLDNNIEEISKIFYKVDAPIHNVFMRMTVGESSLDLKFRNISKDIEIYLRELSRVTGGCMVPSNDINAALEEISGKENICYFLTYAPLDPEKVGKIKVKVSGRKLKAVYDDNIRADYIKDYISKRGKAPQTPTVKINELTFKKKELSVKIAGFALGKTAKGSLGRVGVQITIKDKKGVKIFDKGKILSAKQDSISISIPFPGLKKGKYEIIVDVKDFLTGKLARKNIEEIIKK